MTNRKLCLDNAEGGGLVSGSFGFQGVKPTGLRIRLDAEGSQGGFAIRLASRPLKFG